MKFNSMIRPYLVNILTFLGGGIVGMFAGAALAISTNCNIDIYKMIINWIFENILPIASITTTAIIGIYAYKIAKIQTSIAVNTFLRDENNHIEKFYAVLEEVDNCQLEISIALRKHSETKNTLSDIEFLVHKYEDIENKFNTMSQALVYMEVIDTKITEIKTFISESISLSNRYISEINQTGVSTKSGSVRSITDDMHQSGRRIKIELNEIYKMNTRKIVNTRRHVGI